MTSDTPAPVEWSRAQRLGFRFACAYWLLHVLPAPFEPQFYTRLWQALVPAVGTYVWRVTVPVHPTPTGSGDTLFAWIQASCVLVLALVATLVWSWLDPRRLAYPRLYEALRIYLRYVLAYTMLSYGMSKVIKVQFPTPDIDALMQTYGQSSPMGLLWRAVSEASRVRVRAARRAVAPRLVAAPEFTSGVAYHPRLSL